MEDVEREHSHILGIIFPKIPIVITNNRGEAVCLSSIIFVNFKEYYANNAKEYANNFGMVHTEILDVFLQAVRPYGAILDLGCGPGQDVDYFAKQSFRAIGIDASEQMIRIAKKSRWGLFFVGDMVHCSGTKTFDAVWSASALFTHLKKSDRKKTLRNIHRLLVDGGVLGIIARKKILGKRKIGFYSYDIKTVIVELEENGFVPEQQHFFVQNGESEWICIISRKKV